MVYLVWEGCLEEYVVPFKRVFSVRCCESWLWYSSLLLSSLFLLVSFIDGVVVYYLQDDGLCSLLGCGAL